MIGCFACCYEGLPAVREPCNQTFRHVAFAHLLLRFFNRVGNAPVFKNLIFDIENRVCRIRIIVTWLSYTARIDNQALPVEVGQLQWLRLSP